jgi:N utilization substance protein B
VSDPAEVASASPSSAARSPRSARRKARKYALDVLFAADLQGIDPTAIVDQGLLTSQTPLPDYSRQLIAGVSDHLSQIDAEINAHLKSGWSLDRMPRVDRCLARLAVYETMQTEIPGAVAASEAASLAAELSTSESPQFLSGLLGAIMRSEISTAGLGEDDEPDNAVGDGVVGEEVVDLDDGSGDGTDDSVAEATAGSFNDESSD